MSKTNSEIRLFVILGVKRAVTLDEYMREAPGELVMNVLFLGGTGYQVYQLYTLIISVLFGMYAMLQHANPISLIQNFFFFLFSGKARWDSVWFKILELHDLDSYPGSNPFLS